MTHRFKQTGLAVAALVAVAVGASAIAQAASTDSNSSGSASGNSAQPAPKPGRDGSPGRHPGEKPLTGDTAAKVEAAAKAKVPGATILRVETDAEGDAYEAHVRKSNGSMVTVKFDKNFKVTDVEKGCGPGGHGGPPPPRDGSSGPGAAYGAPAPPTTGI